MSSWGCASISSFLFCRSGIPSTPKPAFPIVLAIPISFGKKFCHSLVDVSERSLSQDESILQLFASGGLIAKVTLRGTSPFNVEIVPGNSRTFVDRDRWEAMGVKRPLALRSEFTDAISDCDRRKFCSKTDKNLLQIKKKLGITIDSPNLKLALTNMLRIHRGERARPENAIRSNHIPNQQGMCH